MSRFAVLGGGGFLGVNLCRFLLQAGHEVTSFGRSMPFQRVLAGCECIEGDYRDQAAVGRAIHRADVVFHLISDSTPQAANADMVMDIENNLVPTVSLLKTCAETGIRRVIFISSGGTVYGRVQSIPIHEDAPIEPITAYGVTKVSIEKYLAIFEYLHGLDYRVVRLANPYGPFQRSAKGQGVIAAFVERIVDNRPLEIWGDGNVVRDYIFVDDAMEALVAAANDTSSHRVFNVGSGIGHSLNDLVRELESLLGRPLKVAYRQGRPVDVPVNVLAIQRARDVLGWAPRTDMRRGLEATLGWASSWMAQGVTV
ncbi:MAG TPA: NAD-dependent epimerase/dehydratase family protein [Acetobacteraceae bacterium]|nr:NAD-dependent epimerase/dehydratase family protein [Acetobacteraceae bacterium]